MSAVEYLQPDAVTAVLVDETARPNPYASGYGRKIPTPYRLRMTDNRVRRVYVMCWSNSGSAYVTVAGRTLFLSTDVEYMLQDAREARRA